MRERYPQVRILALTAFDNDDKIFNALCAGASGHLFKNTRSKKATGPISRLPLASSLPVELVASFTFSLLQD